MAAQEAQASSRMALNCRNFVIFNNISLQKLLNGKQVAGRCLFQLRYQIPGITVLQVTAALRLVVVTVTQQFNVFQPQGRDIALTQGKGGTIGAKSSAPAAGVQRLLQVSCHSVEIGRSGLIYKRS